MNRLFAIVFVILKITTGGSTELEAEAYLAQALQKIGFKPIYSKTLEPQPLNLSDATLDAFLTEVFMPCY